MRKMRINLIDFGKGIDKRRELVYDNDTGFRKGPPEERSIKE